MRGHELTYRREDRLSRLDVRDRAKEIDRYPCLQSCTDPDHDGGKKAHAGMNQFIFAHCACGWNELCGTYIHEYEALLRGRLAHIDHHIEILAGLGLWGRESEATK